jgi:formylglycine-generating enzyme required for sulfatase activity
VERFTEAVRIGGTVFEMVSIPAGEFLMGSDREGESPRHPVRVRAFALGKTEVTVRQFRAFVEATGYRTDAEKEGWGWACCWSKRQGLNWRNPGFPQTDDDPVLELSWYDAAEFCNWLSRETGRDYRLPAESEWEYAARAGDDGEKPADLDRFAWHAANSGGTTHPVAQKQPNSFGLFDIIGNSWEWVADVWNTSYAGAPADGSARLADGSPHKTFAGGEGRVLRGGGWGLGGDFLRYSGRAVFGLHERCNNSGMRIARSNRAAAQ